MRAAAATAVSSVTTTIIQHGCDFMLLCMHIDPMKSYHYQQLLGRELAVVRHSHCLTRFGPRLHCWASSCHFDRTELPARSATSGVHDRQLCAEHCSSKAVVRCVAAVAWRSCHHMFKSLSQFDARHWGPAETFLAYGGLLSIFVSTVSESYCCVIMQHHWRLPFRIS